MGGVREEGAGIIGINGILINNSGEVSIRSVAGASAESIRTAVGRVEGLRSTKYSVIEYTILSVRTTETVGGVMRGVSVPLMTSVRFSCGLTLRSVGGKMSTLEVGPNGVKDERGMRVLTGTYVRGGVPVEVNMGSKSLSGRVLRGCNGMIPRTLIRDTLARVGVLRRMGFGSVIMSVGSSGVRAVVGDCELTSRGFSCPLRLKIARTKAPQEKAVGSTVNLKTLLSRNVKSAVEISLAKSPIRRVGMKHRVLGGFKRVGRKVRFVSYPAYNEARVSLVGVTGRIRGELRGYGGSVGITIVKYIIGKPKRTGSTSVKVTNKVNRNLVFEGKGVMGGIGRRSLIRRLVGVVRALWDGRKVSLLCGVCGRFGKEVWF